MFALWLNFFACLLTSCLLPGSSWFQAFVENEPTLSLGLSPKNQLRLYTALQVSNCHVIFDRLTWWLVPDLKEMAVFQHRKASTESWTWSDLKLESNLWCTRVLCCTAGLLFFFLWAILVPTLRRFFERFDCWLCQRCGRFWALHLLESSTRHHRRPHTTPTFTHWCAIVLAIRTWSNLYDVTVPGRMCFM